ncbi:MAG: hypothetical protein NTY77_07855 [Elusimicrobia bacterium]|nr:hypothetical protein [Elusimicrobiota bacterium]
MASSRKSADWPVLALLTGATAVSLGAWRMGRLGFYHDDWYYLYALGSVPQGMLSWMRILVKELPPLVFRPLEIPLFAALYAAFGAHPLPWHLSLLAINAALAFALFRLLRRFEVDCRGAALCALVFVAYPSKDACVFWPFDLINSLALAAFLAAYLAHLDYVETGRGRSLGLSVAAWIGCIAIYDQCTLLFPLWLLTPRTLREGIPPRAWRGLWAALGVAAISSAYKLWWVPHAFGTAYNKNIMFSLAQAVRVYGLGIAANLGPRLAGYVARSAWRAFTVSPEVAALAFLLPWSLWWLRSKEAAAARHDANTLLALGGAVFLLGYLPIAVSDYIPTPLSHMNRINEVPILGLVLALAGVWNLLGRRRRVLAAGCAAAGLLLAAHVAFADAWSRSYELQLEIRDVIRSQPEKWPHGTKLLLWYEPHYIEEKAPVFIASWDITGAARIWTGDPSREADVLPAAMEFLPEGVAQGGRLLPYKSFRVLDLAHRTIVEVGYQSFHR